MFQYTIGWKLPTNFCYLKNHIFQKVRPVLKTLWKNLSDGTLKLNKSKLEVFLNWISKTILFVLPLIYFGIDKKSIWIQILDISEREYFKIFYFKQTTDTKRFWVKISSWSNNFECMKVCNLAWIGLGWAVQVSGMLGLNPRAHSGSWSDFSSLKRNLWTPCLAIDKCM